MSVQKQIKVYGDIRSGNCYKIKLAAEILGIPYEWQAIDVTSGETRSEWFLSKNPNGRLPIVELPGGDILAESNAILNYLAEGSLLLPQDRFKKAQVLQWQFFEQYSHEPYIAVSRYIQTLLGLPEERRAEHASKKAGGLSALGVMETQLAKTPFLIGEEFTIADISLYAYTHVAHEGGFSLEDFPAIRQWITRVQSIPGYVEMV